MGSVNERRKNPGFRYAGQMTDRRQPAEGLREFLTAKEIEDWRTKIKNKIFSDFLDEPNEAHGKQLQQSFDTLCDLALRGLQGPADDRQGLSRNDVSLAYNFADEESERGHLARIILRIHRSKP